MRVGFGIDAQRGAGFLVENIDCRGVFIPEDPTDEQRRIRRSASDFVDREVPPQVERLESLDLWESRPLMRKRGSLDLLAFTYALVDSAPIDTVGPSVGPKARSPLLSLRRRGVGTAGAAARAFGLVGAIACAESAGAQSIEGIVDEPTGEARYTIPILTPPGTAGTGPDLALVYSSGTSRGAAGWVGLGWAVGGESRIQRNARRGVPYDYENYAPPQMCGSGPCYLDHFEVDQSDLVCAELDCASDVYKTRIDDGRRIRFLSESTGWEIHSRDGTRSIYGASASHRIVNPTNNQVYAWLLERVEDLGGNWIDYTYDAAEPNSPGIAYLRKIEYAQSGAPANRTVEFLRESRPDHALSFRGGLREESTERLARIEVRAGHGTGELEEPPLVTAYELEYTQAPTSGRSVLSSVQRFGHDNVTALPAHTFEYSSRAIDPHDNALFGFEENFTHTTNGSPTFSDTLTSSVLVWEGLADLNGDALVDYYKGPGPWFSSSGTRGYLSNGITYDGLSWSLEFAAPALLHEDDLVFSYSDTENSSGGTGLYTATLDLTGDGKADHVRGAWKTVYVGSATGYGDPIPWAIGSNDLPSGDPYAAFMGDVHLTWVSDDNLWINLIDLTGDGLPDRVHCKFASQTWGNGFSGWMVYPNLGVAADGLSGGFSVNAVDWPDPMGLSCQQGQFEANSGQQSNVTSLTADVNGDGLPDHIRTVFDVGIAVSYNNGSGFDPEVVVLNEGNSLFLKESAGGGHWRAELLDINGDGFLDYVAVSDSFATNNHYGANEHPAIWTVWFGHGTGFNSTPTRFGACHEPSYPGGWNCDEYIFDFTSAYAPAWNRLVTHVDMNGDGLLDHVEGRAGNLVYLSTGPIEDLLTSATSPLGGKVSFEYSTSGQMKDETVAPANPGMSFSRPVVERVTVESDPSGIPIVSEYHYAGGIFDSDLRAFHGYATVERTELFDGGAGSPEGTMVRSTYAVDEACVGRRERVEVEYGAASLTEEQRTYLAVSGPSGATHPLETWHACLIESVTNTSREELGTPAQPARARRVEYRYSADPASTHYNVEQIDDLGEVNADTLVDIAGDERTTRFEYVAANAALNLVSLVSERWVEDPAAPDTKHAHTRFYYDGLALGAAAVDGRLTEQERWYDNAYSDPNATPGWVSTRQLGYDGFGNLTDLIGAPHELSGGGTARSEVELAYDASYATFLVSRTQKSDAAGSPALPTLLAYTGCGGPGSPPPGLGLVCTATSPGGLVTIHSYDPLGRPVETLHPSGLSDGRAYALPAPAGPIETVLTTTLDDPLGSVLISTVTLDGLGRQIRLDRPGKVGETIRVELAYDDRGQLASETLPRRIEAADPTLTRFYTYDPLGRPETALDVDGQTLRTSIYDPWTATGEVYFGAELPANRQGRTERTFDAYGRLATVTNYENLTDPLTDPLTVTAHYDVLHQLTQVDDPIENDVTLCYEQNDCPDQSHTTQLGYDTLGRRVWIDDPDSGEWLFRYDASGRLAVRTDAKGNVSSIAYDALGRVASRGFGAGETTNATFLYEDDSVSPDFGRLIEVDHPTAGIAYAYEYDAVGRLSQVEQVTYGLRFTNRYTYDAFGRVDQRTYPDGEIYRHVYDGARLVAFDKENAGGFNLFLSAEYDALGRMTALEVGATSALVSTSPAATLERVFDPATARLVGMKAIGRGRASNPNLDLTLQFDGMGRLTQMDGTQGPTGLGLRNFTYDGLGRLKTASGPWEQLQGQSTTATWTYAYDVLGNLRSQGSDSTPNPYTRTWEYADADRPRFLTTFQELENGAPVATDVMVPDAAGNTASINGEGLLWNAQNRMTARGNPFTNGANYFDWSGKRVMRWWFATQLIYVGSDFEYDTGLGLGTKFFFLNGERVATRSIYYTAQSAWVPPWAYRWIVTPLGPAVIPALIGLFLLGMLALLLMGLGVRVPAWVAAPGVALLATALVLYPYSVARAVIGGGGDPEWHGGHSKGILIYGNDHLGSTRVVIDATGATVETRDYAPFGKTISHAGAFKLKHRFTSQPYDDLVELYNYGARMYEPRWGRFVSSDDLVEGFSPQGLNSYSYALNRPTSLTDPSGQFTVVDIVIMVVSFSLFLQIRQSPDQTTGQGGRGGGGTPPPPTFDTPPSQQLGDGNGSGVPKEVALKNLELRIQDLDELADELEDEIQTQYEIRQIAIDQYANYGAPADNIGDVLTGAMGQALALKDKMVAEDEIAKFGRLLAENRAQKAEAMARMEKLKAD